MAFFSRDVSTATTDTLVSFSGVDSMSTRHSLEALSRHLVRLVDIFRISSLVPVLCRWSCRVVGRWSCCTFSGSVL